MNNIFLHTPYDCLVICDKEQQFLQTNQIMRFDNPVILSIYPTENSKNNISFLLDLNADTDDSRFVVVDFKDDRHFYLKNGQICTNFALSTINLGQVTCKFEIGENEVIASSQTFKKCFKMNEKFSNFQTGSIGELFYCLLRGAQEERLLLISASGTSQMFVGEQIELSRNNFTVSKSVDDIARHTVEEQYLVIADKITSKGQQIGYQSGRAVIAMAGQVVPYAFLEAMKVEDFNLALSYLSLSMRRQLDKQHLSEFFGKIQEFYPIDKENYLLINHEGKKIYHFILEENKITEIEIY